MATKRTKNDRINPRTVLLPQAVTSSPRCPAPFAVATDGTLLINVGAVEAIPLAKLRGRRLFIGAELFPVERRRIRFHLSELGDEMCAKLVGALRGRRKPEAK